MSSRPLPLDPGRQPISMIVLQRQRAQQVDGISRRTLLRRSLGVGIGLLAAEWLGGSIGFLWSAAASSPVKVRIGTLADLVSANAGLPIAEIGRAHV